MCLQYQNRKSSESIKPLHNTRDTITRLDYTIYLVAQNRKVENALTTPAINYSRFVVIHLFLSTSYYTTKSGRIAVIVRLIN